MTLEQVDSEIVSLIAEEVKRRGETIQLIAAENVTRNPVLAPLSSIFVSKTAEGTPGARYHSGCSVVDRLETVAQQRAQELLNARRAWVQPLSGSLANLIVLTCLFGNRLQDRRNVRIFSMGLDQGGHLSHGAKAHISGMLFPKVKPYNVGRNSGLLDYASIAAEALRWKPDLIICGASAYPRAIDFAAMGAIAQKSGSILLCDIAHIFGLVASAVHQSPIPHSHFVTASTYKGGGPKGGIILAGDLATDEQVRSIDRAIFPGVQSTPDFGSIAAKAVFFKECMSEEYRATQRRIVSNAAALAEALQANGLDVVTGGTDNHIVLVNVKSSVNLTGKEADRRLERCGLNPHSPDRTVILSALSPILI